MTKLLRLHIQQAKRLAWGWRECAVEPEETTIAGHSVVDKVEILLNRRDLLREQIDRHPIV